MKQEIINKYIELAKKLERHPHRSDLLTVGISRDKIRHHFGSLQKLKAAIKAKHKDLAALPEEASLKAPKVLIFDIETAPIEAWVWGLWDNNVPLNMIKTDWFVLSWSAKWLHEDKVMYQDLRSFKHPKPKNDKKLLKGIWDLLNEADIVVTHNGDKFDIKKLNARFVIHGLGKPASFKSTDTLKVMKKHFAMTSNKLEYAAKVLELKYEKQEHKKFPGFSLWRACLDGNPEAWAEMETYNTYDSLVLEALYKKLGPWTNDINFDLYHNQNMNICKCGSKIFLPKQKFFMTKSGKFQLYGCTGCGAESRGKENLLSEAKKESLKIGLK